MNPISLTIAERQILVNQYTILAKLDLQDGLSPEDYYNKIEILTSGYTGEYDEVFSVYSEEMSIEICVETIEILNMFRAINITLGTLSEEQKSTLCVDRIKFDGFDANNDPHYTYAKFMIEKQKKWEELNGFYLNSHDSAPIHRYRRMLKYCQSLWANHKLRFDMDDIKGLIEAS